MKKVEAMIKLQRYLSSTSALKHHSSVGERSIAIYLLSTALIAQPVQAQDQSAGEAENSYEIIVTAQRRSESIQNVPISIIALNEESLITNNILTASCLKSSVCQIAIVRLLSEVDNLK